MTPRSLILRTTCSVLTVAGLALTSAISAPPKKAPAKEDAGKGVGSIYFLTEAVSVPTDSGVTGAPAGTRVTCVGTVPGGMKVKMLDGPVFSVKLNQVTDDPVKGAQLVSTDAARQSAVAAQLSASQAAAQADEAERQRVAREAVQAAQASTAGSGTATFTPGAVGGGNNIKGSALDAEPEKVGSMKAKKVLKAPVRNQQRRR